MVSTRSSSRMPSPSSSVPSTPRTRSKQQLASVPTPVYNLRTRRNVSYNPDCLEPGFYEKTIQAGNKWILQSMDMNSWILSDKLARFISKPIGTTMSRKEVHQHIYKYILANGLGDIRLLSSCPKISTMASSNLKPGGN